MVVLKWFINLLVITMFLPKSIYSPLFDLLVAAPGVALVLRPG